MPSSISQPQADILAFYKQFLAKHGRAPSIREAATALRREASNVHYHLKNLERMGLLVRTGGHRGVQLVGKASSVVPMLGVVACGEPITIFEESNEFVYVPQDKIAKGYAHYALRAKGDSMINAGIRDGAVLVIRKQTDVDDGDVAVVVTGEMPLESATLKRVYHANKALLLKPENDNLEPYVIRQGEVRGKLVCVINDM